MVPILTLHRNDLKDDNAEALITELCRWASSRPIPINFDENLQRPTGSNNIRLVKSSTLVKYVGKIIKYFRSVDPTHPDWKDQKSMDDVPDWWTALRPLFQKEAKALSFCMMVMECLGQARSNHCTKRSRLSRKSRGLQKALKMNHYAPWIRSTFFSALSRKQMIQTIICRSWQ